MAVLRTLVLVVVVAGALSGMVACTTCDVCDSCGDCFYDEHYGAYKMPCSSDAPCGQAGCTSCGTATHAAPCNSCGH